MSEENISAWDRQLGEPTRWYAIFTKYYLGAGSARSVASAFLQCSKDAGQDSYERALQRRGAPVKWYTMARKWDWQERANAYDMHTSELAMGAVEDANKRLRQLAVNAVLALELALKSDRFSVQAAKEILDRAGLPATTRQEINNSVTLTSDDMAQAREELERWEQKNKS